jgi:polyisoprenoid-binding protein YceI
LTIEAFSQLKFDKGTVSFSIKNAGLTVNGSFGIMKANISFDPKNPEMAQLEGRVDVNSIETGIKMRNKHLKKEEYFHTEKYPEILMKLNKVQKDPKGLTGYFWITMRGIKKEVSFPLIYSTVGDSGNLKGSFTLNRRDFNVGGSSWTMADEVKVKIEVQLIPR